MQPAWFIGLMTGTVLDGMIDVAAIRTDGHDIIEFGNWTLAPYGREICATLEQAVQAALAWQFGSADPALFASAETSLTTAQAQAVADFMIAAGLRKEDVAAIGFHGQTVLHRAPDTVRYGDTRQLGDGPQMAHALGIDVVYDFRRGDMRAGGQGAPLSASYHDALLRRIDAGCDTAVLNLGGVANITWRDNSGELHAFDTGPANAPINDWIRRHNAGEMDRDGTLAQQGTVDEARLKRLLNHPYLSAPYPKSLDRYGFLADMADGLSLEDGAATLTAFTAAAVGRGLHRLPLRPSRLIVCGGGRKNPSLMAALAERVDAEIVSAEAVGWRGDAVEAECFAYLAARRLAGLPISFPKTTGVPYPMVGGVIARHQHAADGETLTC
ncbi:anhydro-N-acetylmuramic acid kinase [Sphingobium algorifonticola]|uniref:Anhydro-N-acetylmuramic acid kinase n=1 Tax=Sphingobium algorifonticola TaxID=2008318 RepID=A0A437JAB4_9SPHN|nr:anhydro-N-acetylmuramic acid kinase [Sphingobium algorifonticola]RVT42323.1 anhydro-N-acetylmuramic acid kinase [Sphingobium algorifonticola]